MSIPKTYDDAIKSAAEKYLPAEYDWRLLKAQLFQESQLDPTACSPVGARGIAQFMPATWGDMVRQLEYPADASCEDPTLAIPACAHYMAQLLVAWERVHSWPDQQALALASYNAGAGNINHTWLLCNSRTGAGCAQAVFDRLPQITGVANAHQTQTYVSRIHEYLIELLAEDGVHADAAA